MRFVMRTTATSKNRSKRCLFYEFKLDCKYCTLQTYQFVIEKLKSTESEKIIKDKTITIKLCSACYSYICAETNAIFDKIAVTLEESPMRKTNMPRALTSRQSALSPAMVPNSGSSIGFTRKDTFFNFGLKEESPTSSPYMRYGAQGSKLNLGDDLSESLIEVDNKKDMTNMSMQRDVLSDMDDYEIVEYYYGLFPELREHSEEMVQNIMVKVGDCLL